MPSASCRCRGTGADGCEPHEPQLDIPTIPLHLLADSGERALPPTPTLGVVLPLRVLGALDQARAEHQSEPAFAPVIQLRTALPSGRPDAA